MEQQIRQVLLPVDKQGRGREAGINPTIPAEAQTGFAQG
jgi:hypothetical protein